MSDEKKDVRLSKATKDLGVGIDHIIEFLNKNGIQVEKNPNTKISADAFFLLTKEFAPDMHARQEANEITPANPVLNRKLMMSWLINYLV